MFGLYTFSGEQLYKSSEQTISTVESFRCHASLYAYTQVCILSILKGRLCHFRIYSYNNHYENKKKRRKAFLAFIEKKKIFMMLDYELL